MLGLKRYTWDEVRKDIKKVDQKLATVIDEISPPDSHSLYIGEYPYGDLILNKGIFQVINDDGLLVPLSHSSIDSEVQQDLSYTGTIPVGIINQNSIETFFIFENRTIPSSFYTSGGIISLWSVFEGNNSYQVGPLWSISSGARTVCMLPKITDKACYETLQHKYSIKQPTPRTLGEHWKLFTSIANHKAFSQEWSSKIIYFSKRWFEHKDDRAWASFYQLLLKKAWDDSTIKRNQFIFDFAFSLAQKSCGLKPNPYLADTVKHLVNICMGGLPGFKPATDNTAAPVAGLQKTYIEDYGLKKLPIIMQPYHFSWPSKEPLYYSLEMPTTTIFSPRSSNGVTRMVDMRELKHLLEVFFSEILNCNLMVEKTPLFKLAKSVQYNFYHTDEDKYSEITPVTEMVALDSRFNKLLYNTDSDLAISEFASFFRGCISLSRAN